MKSMNGARYYDAMALAFGLLRTEREGRRDNLTRGLVVAGIRLQVHAETVGEPIDKGVVTGDLVDVEDGGIGEVRLAQSNDILLDHF